MGVQGLWQVLEPVGKPVALETLENKVLGVDVSLWLHQAVKGMRDAQGQPVGNAHLVVLLQRVCKLLFYRIKPVFVFDGGVPQLKKQTLACRQQRHAEALEEAHRQRARRALLAHAQKRLRGGAAPPLLPKSPKKSPKKPPPRPGPASALSDLYELPPLPAPVDTLDSDEEDERSRYSTRLAVPDSVDVDSEDFAALPADVRCEVLAALHEQHRYGSRDRSLPEDSESFSSYQMSRLLKKRTLKEKLEDARRDLTHMRSQQWITREEEEEKDAQVWRTASEVNTHQILFRKGQTSAANGSNTPSSKPDDTIPTQHSWTRLRQSQAPLVPRGGSPIPEERPDNRDSSRTVADELYESATSDDEMAQQWHTSERPDNIIPLLTEHCRTSNGRVRAVPEEPLNSPKEEFKDLRNCGSSAEHVDTSSAAAQKPEFIPGETLKSVANEQPSSMQQVETVEEKPVTGPKNIERSTTSVALLDISGAAARKPTSDTDRSLEAAVPTNSCRETDGTKLPSNPVAEMTETVLDSPKRGESPIWCSEPSPSLEQKASRSVETKEGYDHTFAAEHTEEFDSRTERDTVALDGASDAAQEETLDRASYGGATLHTKSNASAKTVVEEIEQAAIPTDDMFAEVFATETEQQRQHREELNEQLEETGRRMEVEAGRLELQAAQLSQQMAAECQELLRLLGQPYVVSPEEAEAQCAQLELLGLTQGTITDDSDVWLFGGSSVYKHFFQREKFVEHFALRDIMAHCGLDRQKLIAFALLSGSDYTTGVRGVGPVTAMEILSEFNAQEALAILQAFREWLDKAKSNQALPGTATRSHLQRLQLEPGFPSSTVVQAYLSPAVDSSRERFSWGLPDLDALRTFGTEKLGWSREKMDALLLPVLKRVQEKQSQSRIDNYFSVEVAKREQLFPSKRLRRAARKVAKRAAKQPTPQEPELSEESD